MKKDHKARLRSALNRELDDNEELVWTGFPSPGHLRRKARDIVIGGLFVGGFISVVFTLLPFLAYHTHWVNAKTANPESTPEYWRYVLQSEGPWYIGLLPLVLSLLSFLAYPYYKEIARQQIYAITTRRAIRLRMENNGNVIEIDYGPKELTHLARFEKPDVTGNLTFQGARGAYATAQVGTGHGFYAIESVLEVERLLRKQFGDGINNPAHPLSQVRESSH